MNEIIKMGMKATELKVTDLMVGDWVMSFGAPHKVVGIRTDMFEPHIRTDMSDTWYEEGIENLLEPIHLTPEILEKNGFVYADLPFENFYEGYGLRIYGGNFADGHSNWYIICGINVSMNVTHVHELQHALRLCNIEKEITL